MTLLLSRADVKAALDVPAVLAALGAGFRATGDPLPAQRVGARLPGPGTAMCLLPGLLPGVPAYTVKVNAKFPAATPALRGIVCLHALADGELLALLDSASVTAWRTGLAAALATHALAPEHATRVAVIGAGAQNRTVLKALRTLRPVDEVYAYDLDPARAAAVGRAVPTARAAVEAADIVLTATWSREPLLDADVLRPGLHLTSLGFDEPGKTELSPALLRASRLVVDDPALAAASGVLHGAALDPAHATTLADVLRGTAPARPDDRATVYAPIGLPWQDLALAWPVYLAARSAATATSFTFH
ncbi:ornithine cyclodeaminase family protein [Kitasatospora sp. NPDC057500]|uniref:ornithine cyclodeaminase family protein n=1 Tax=Kitasatospora sp. NPDC057500 TaxID=3346151 RepID=UPI0036BE1C9B